MKFLHKPNDNFFYFFGVYSLLFVFFNFINYLSILAVITYIGFVVFFCYRLHDYYSFVKQHKPRIKKLAIWKTQKELSILVEEAQENMREGTIIISITLCVFVAFFLLWMEGKKELSDAPTFAWAEFLEAERLRTQTIPTQIIEENEEEIIQENPWEESDNEDILLEETEEIQETIKPTEEPELSIDEIVIAKPVRDQEEITGNLLIEGNDDSLKLWRNFDTQVKDVYNLQPFTKNGSSFLNILQLQKVLNSLWYYSWIADGVFNFETKLAIYNTLVQECWWPAATTTWVFGAQAKACIDNLYIVVQDFETDWLPE